MAGETSYAQLPVALKGGLDLTTPRMLVEPGRLVHCLNYECVDTDGYKKIDGFERYDGGPTPSITGFFIIRTVKSSGSALNIFAGQDCTISYTDEILSTNRVITVRCARTYTSGGRWYIEFNPPVPLHLDTSTYALIQNIPVGDQVSASTEAALNASNYVDVTEYSSVSTSITSADTVRADVDALPDSAFPYALQLYKNRMHVVANCRAIYLAFDTDSAAPAITNIEFFVGNYLRVGSGTGKFEGRILDWKFLRGNAFDLTSTTYANRYWIKVLVYPTNPNGTLATNTICYIDRINDTFGTTISCWKYYSAIDAYGPTDDEPIWGGVLYKSLEEDVDARSSSTNAWTQIDMGYEVSFNAGSSTIEPRELTLATTTAQLNNEIQTLVEGPAAEVASFSQPGMQAYQNSAASFPGSTADGGLALTTPDVTTANTTGVYLTQTTGIWMDSSADNTFKNLGLAVPDDVIVTGITVTARCFYNSSAVVPDVYFNKIQLTLSGSENKGSAAQSLNAVANATSATAKTFTLGGQNDMWGLSGITPADLNSADFGVHMNPAPSSTSTCYLFWDYVTVTVHYFRPVGKLFFNDGTSTLEAKLVRIHLEKGGWNDSTTPAEGIAHIYDIDPNGTRNYIKAGDTIRLTAGGSTIATVRSIRSSFLPSHADLVASDRRFETIRANYYLNPEWETIYGVHGLGRAFSYDNVYFRKIYTDYDSSLDKPTHLASYRNYLALGFTSGNVLLSAISGDRGPLPEEFGATQGSREFSFIDHIHGLKELADTSLGVFCKSSINRLVLNTTAATADSIFYTAVISPNSGCIEYTVAGFGDSTLYCDQYGIRTVEQTDVYGDLIAKPLSYQVSPWLRPRLSSKKYWNNNRDANKPLFAHTIKAKNQYRVWFDDGYVLCMNLNTKDSPPQFTLLRYGFNFGGSFVPLTPIAFCQDTDDSVTERLHVAHWNRLSTSSGAENSSTLFKYVFELERGWSFDGQDFPCRLTVNLSLLDSPYDFDSIRKAELHGLDYNNTTLFCGWGTKYSEELSYSGLTMGDTFTPAARNVEASISDDYVPFCKVIQSGNRGRPLLMKLKNSTTATGTEATSVIEPPHILQAVLLQYLPLKTQG